MVRFLLKMGADCLAEGEISPMYAVMNGHIGILRWLLTVGKYTKTNMLISCALQYGHLEIAALIYDLYPLNVSAPYAERMEQKRAGILRDLPTSSDLAVLISHYWC